MMGREKLEAHAVACRDAVNRERATPRWGGGSLAGADLTGMKLGCVNLASADLSGANFTDADLFASTLDDANLTDANLTGACLRLATLTGANLSGARLSEGVARGRAIGGVINYRTWWAVALEKGGAVLSFGERGTLDWWRTKGSSCFLGWSAEGEMAFEAARALAVKGTK